MRCPKCSKRMSKEKRKDTFTQREIVDGKLVEVKRTLKYVVYTCPGCGHTFSLG